MKRDNTLKEETLKLDTGRIMVVSDIHFPYEDKSAVTAFIREVGFKRPEVIVLNGDLLDFYKLSKFSKDPAGKNPEEEIEMCKTFLKCLRREAGKECKIYYTIGNHECFDKRTEVLTPQGWVNISEAVNKKIKRVLGYNIKTGLIEETKVVEYHRSFCPELLNVETCNTKQIVTPNHELLLGDNKVMAFAAETDNLHKLIKPCAKSNQLGVDITDEEIKLITWICTDGCIVFNKPRIQFKLSIPEKIENLKNLLLKMKIPFTFTKATLSGHNKLQPYYIRIYGQAARNIIKRYFFQGKKEFPSCFSYLEENQLNVLLETIVLTDGAKKENRIYFYSSNKHNLDLIQEVCVKNNLSCRIDEGKSGFNPLNKTYKAMITKNYDWIKYQNKIEPVKYNDYVYCLTTKLGTLVTRIDGKVAITGNSRLRKYILDNAPMVAGLMENVFSLLKLEEPDVVGCASLLVNDTFMFKHGSRLGNKSGLSAIKELEAHYLSGATGHVHKLARYSVRKSKRRFLWLETGCLCSLDPEYMIDPDWEQGIGIVTFEKGKLKNAQVYPIVNGAVLYD